MVLHIIHFNYLDGKDGNYNNNKKTKLRSKSNWYENFLYPRCNSLKIISETPKVYVGTGDTKIQRNGSTLIVYTIKLLEEILDVVKSIDDTIPDVKISKDEYYKQVRIDYKKYIEKMRMNKEMKNNRKK